MTPKVTQVKDFDPNLQWIDPIGGLGDCLFLSSVLHDLWETTGRTFGLCRKAPYGSFFSGHPAIIRIGSPPPYHPAMKVDYWSYETIGPGNGRPYQVLSRMFGLPTPREERLWIPVSENDFETAAHYPLQDGFIVLAPTSVSPRKIWAQERWARLADELGRKTGRQLVQVGEENDFQIPGTVSLCGLTSPKQLFAVMAKASLAIVVDAFPLHAAAWAKIPTVALWGASRHDTFGYSFQVNIQAPSPCRETCFGPRKYDIYLSPCDHKDGYCLDNVQVDEVLEKASPFL